MTRPRTILLLTLAVMGVLAGVGRADDGPIIIAHHDAHPFLTLDPFSGSVGIGGIYESDSATSSSGSSRSSDFLLTPQLTLATGGSVLSSNVLKWTATGTASAQEDWSTGIDSTGASTAFLDAYALNMDILGGSQYPVNVYADRSQSYVNREFAGILRNTITDYGANVQYRSPVLPSTLNASHTTTTQSDLAGLTQYTIDQDILNFATSFQGWERHNISLNYSYGTTNQDNPGALSNNSQTQSLALNHDWSIDPLAHYTLSQSFNYTQQEGTFNQTDLRLSNQLRMRLTENLDGNVTYTYERQDYQGSQADSQLLSASLTHRLFDSVTTTGRAGVSLTDNAFSGTGTGATSSTQDNYFANIATNYTKKVWLGRFGANLSLGFNENQNGAIGQEQQVLGDVQTFNDPQPIILTRTGIDAASIAVFDATGTRRYVPGVDYTVTTVNHSVQIQRLLGGNIPADDTVRLNYDINPLPAYTSQSLSLGAGTSYAFDEGLLKGLNIYLRYYQVDQTISPSSAGILPDSVKDTTFGAEYRVWKLTLRAEEEIRDSTLAPFNSLRFSAGYIDKLSDKTSLSIDATQSFITVPTDNSSEASSTLDARLQYEIARNLHAAISAQWRHDDFSNTGTSVGLEEQAELRWNFRQTQVFLVVQHSSLNAQGTNDDTTIVQFGFTRSF